MTELSLADQQAFREFLEEAALWHRAQTRATTVVEAAVRALLDGVESPSLILIAALGTAEAEAELSELLAAALDEFDLDCLGFGDPENDVLATAALSRRYLDGRIEAQEFTEQIHQTYGHFCHPLVEAVSRLDDQFDALEYVRNPTRAQLEQRTSDAAKALLSKADAICQRSKSHH